MSKEISLKNKDHSKRDTTSNLDIAYPVIIPGMQLNPLYSPILFKSMNISCIMCLFIDNSGMQTMVKPRSLSVMSKNETKNLPQGTGEKAKESIQHPELDINRLINPIGPNTHKKIVSSLVSASSNSSINSNSLSSPINQSTNSPNPIAISVISENSNEKVTTPKGKKFFLISKDTIRNVKVSSSISPPPTSKSNSATKQTNDSSSKNKNGSNSTTESSVNTNPTSPLLRAVYSKWYCLNGLDTLYYGSSSSSLVH